MSNKRPTPETDKQCDEADTIGIEVVSAQFARRLERERDDVKALILDLRNAMKEIAWSNDTGWQGERARVALTRIREVIG